MAMLGTDIRTSDFRGREDQFEHYLHIDRRFPYDEADVAFPPELKPNCIPVYFQINRLTIIAPWTIDEILLEGSRLSFILG